LLAQINAQTSQILLSACLMLMGGGMGLSIPAFLIAVQSSVSRRSLGTATSTLQFSRNIGGTLGVSVMGAVLSTQLAGRLASSGLDPAAVSINSLLDPIASGGVGATLDGAIRVALAGSIQSIFIIALGAAVLGLLVTLLTPRGDIAQLDAKRSETENAQLDAKRSEAENASAPV
jgi:hypothetical protein